MTLPASIKERLRPQGTTSVSVIVRTPGRRKVIRRINASDITCFETNNHNMKLLTMDNEELEVIHKKSEIIDKLKEVCTEQNLFCAIGRCYIVNLNNLETVEDTDYTLSFKMRDGSLHSLKPSKQAMDAFHRLLNATDGTDVPIAEKHVVMIPVSRPSSGSSDSGLSGFVQPGATRYEQVVDYCLDDDKVYLI